MRPYMTNMTNATPPRPCLVLRVGITGTRVLPQDERQRQVLRDNVAAVLRSVRQEVTRIAADPRAQQAYAIKPPVLVLVSPLAEGADRLVADIATSPDHGYALRVAMPFQQDNYEADFLSKDGPPDSLSEFRTLLARAASVLQLDGGRDDPQHDRYDEARSYEAVGRFVVRNCDLVIAIWDGKPGKGRGGTADTVQFSADFGPAVWWIHAERDQPPVWIADAQDLRYPKPDNDAAAKLRAYLEHLILPPEYKPPRQKTVPWIEHIADIGYRPASPLRRWFEEQNPHRPWWAHAHRLLLKRAAGCYEPPWDDASHPEENKVAAVWHNLYALPDQCAADNAARYRSVYVQVFALASLALICAAISLSVPGFFEHWHILAERGWHIVKQLATFAELVVLLIILWLVVTNIRYDWHQCWIDYRLLAELYRKQQALAVLGWSLSGRAVRALVEQQEETGGDRAAWVVWLFAAMVRAAPVPTGVLNYMVLERARRIVLRDLVNEQITYHKGRFTQNERAEEFFVKWGERLFALVIIIVVIKLFLLFWPGADLWTTVLGLAAAVVPTLAAASVGVRAYAELELLARQSHTMLSAMELGRRRIENIDLTRPLASQELGTEVYEVAIAMLQDVQGWVRLFRVKLVEAG
jgi:hypothetical protein